ncbi:bolA-like protein 3 [Rhodnius prolixus]|uniref:bolA-like protein 3 n=1 Tax=Rhodnius prolixus TaxID=13249 RepID=UPI003D1894C9
MSNYLKRLIKLSCKNSKFSVVLNRRLLSASPPENAENKLKRILNINFPQAETIEVVDVSGGCGAMYDISIKSPEFKGLSIVKQHKLVTEVLKEEIKSMHGLRIQTSAT